MSLNLNRDPKCLEKGALMQVLRNSFIRSRPSCRVVSGCCLLAVMAFTVHAQPLTFTTFAGSAGGPRATHGTAGAARPHTPPRVGAARGGGGPLCAHGAHNHPRITPPRGW